MRRLVSAAGRVWALTAAGVSVRAADASWSTVSADGAPVNDLTVHRGSVVMAAGNRLFHLVGARLDPLGTNQARFEITRVLSHQDALYVHEASIADRNCVSRLRSVNAACSRKRSERSMR